MKILNSNLSKVKMISCFYKSKKNKTSFKDFASRIFDSKKELSNQGTVERDGPWFRTGTKNGRMVIPEPFSSVILHKRIHKTNFSRIFRDPRTAMDCYKIVEIVKHMTTLIATTND